MRGMERIADSDYSMPSEHARYPAALAPAALAAVVLGLAPRSPAQLQAARPVPV